ncbi:MAG: PAS domain S-box protein [Sterolibacterium sp.]
MNDFVSTADKIPERRTGDSELRKLSLAVAQSTASIVITNTKALIEYVNPAFSAISGYAAEEVIGHNPRMFQSGRTPRKTYDELWASLSQGKTWRGELTNRRKDGAEYVEQAIISPVRGADGQVRQYLAVKEDITERIQAAALLRASLERLRLAQDTAGLGIYDIDMISGAIHLDARIRELWGIDPDQQATYDTLVAGVHPEDRSAMAAAMAGNGKHHAEYRVIGHAGDRLRTVALVGQTFFEAGRAVRFIGTVHDITERKRTEKVSKQRRGEMDALIKHQVAAQTAAAIAHEINQPLVAISAYGEAALRSLRVSASDPDKLRHALEGCIEQAQRAGRTLNKLLDYLHRGKSEASPFDIDELVRETAAIARDEGYDEFHAAIEIEPGLPAVLGNRLQVQKVLLNLLSNGAEAMRENGTKAAVIAITAQTWTERNKVLVTVRDSGPGLDADKAERVFEPFFTTKPNGIGLGLAISRALIEAQDEELWFDPDDKPGAAFHFTLPFARE